MIDLPGRRLLPLALFALAGARPARATTAADVPCQASSPPGQCVVGTTVPVSAGSILDFGPLTLVLTSTGTLDAGGGAMVVRAGGVVLQPGSLVASAGGRITVTATAAIQVQESSGTRAKVDVSGQSGGVLALTAGGDVTVNGQLLAVAAVVLGDGGSVDVTGATVGIGPTGKLAATGGRSGFGGDIALAATTGSTVIGGLLDTSAGADGGYITLDAQTDVITTATAVVNARAGEGGSADAIDITAATGKASLAGTISAAAAGSLDLGGGSGGDVSVDALGPITLDAAIDASGGGPGAFGGSIDLTTSGDILARGAMDVSASGTGGVAGFVSADTLGGQVVVTGRIDAVGPTTGGDISAFSFNNITVSSRLTADGPNARIELKGCAVAVTSPARLSSAGPSGQNLLRASGQLTVGGLVLGSAPGANRFEFLDPAKQPAYVPANVSPPPAVALNPSLFPCGGPTTTTTTTAPTTSTRTTTSTTTTSLPRFLVCDLAPARTDLDADGDTLDAGEFGNGLINNADIVQLFRASLLGPPVRPPAGSDLFGAMDAAPEDAPPVCGGNGSIVNNDVVLCFRRSLLPALPRYTRTRDGSTCRSAPLGAAAGAAP